MTDPIINIVAHRAGWRAEYVALAEVVRDALGSAVVALHHIGSTSVPELPAKDVIDLQLTVESLQAYAHERLEAAGFEVNQASKDHCPPGLTLADEELAKHYCKYRGRAANLHVREAGRFNQQYAILCRDYLRTHKLAAAAYAEIKIQLARYFPSDVDAYYAIKDPTFDVLMVGAREWAMPQVGKNHRVTKAPFHTPRMFGETDLEWPLSTHNGHWASGLTCHPK